MPLVGRGEGCVACCARIGADRSFGFAVGLIPEGLKVVFELKYIKYLIN